VTLHAKLLASALITALALPAQAEQVVCHLNYGGQEQLLIAQPSDSPYGIKPTSIGSYFLFRIVFRTRPAELAGIKLYTYVDQASGPALIHQASYPYPVAKAFTGIQQVYEPVRDSELEYSCELQAGLTK
jgi:hypothetical protein